MRISSDTGVLGMVSLEQVKKIELEILKVVSSILDKHNLTWYLIYGSCLGAVRHNGFIPWDDDIDVGLLREDYEKAKIILIDELPRDYLLCDRLTETDYPYNYFKVRKNHTAFVHSGDEKLNIHQGIYIDIFPLDYCPSNLIQFNKIYRKTKVIRQLIDFKCMNYMRQGKLRPIWQLPIIFISHMTINKLMLQEKLDALLTSYNKKSDDVCSYLGDYGEKARSKTEWFGKGKEVLFEGLKCRIPLKYDSYLSKMYGDYMKLPPKSQRRSHHDCIYLSIRENYNSSQWRTNR